MWKDLAQLFRSSGALLSWIVDFPNPLQQIVADVCSPCAMQVCDNPRDVEYDGFQYGSDYPLPRYVDAQCACPDPDPLRAEQVDLQLAADSMAGVNLSRMSSLLSPARAERRLAGGAGVTSARVPVPTQQTLRGDAPGQLEERPSSSRRDRDAGVRANQPSRPDGRKPGRRWKVGGLDHLR